MMATRITRANPNAAPPLEDHSRKAQYKKNQKTIKKTVTFEDDEEQDSGGDDEPKDSIEIRKNPSSRSFETGNQKKNNDLPFKDVP